MVEDKIDGFGQTIPPKLFLKHLLLRRIEMLKLIKDKSSLARTQDSLLLIAFLIGLWFFLTNSHKIIFALASDISLILLVIDLLPERDTPNNQ